VDDAFTTRRLFHSSAEADDRPQARSPEFIRRAGYDAALGMERTAGGRHAAPGMERARAIDHWRAVRRPGRLIKGAW